MTAVAFASELAHDSGVFPQVSSSLLVPPNVSVDRLVADVHCTVLLPHPRDLLGAEPSPQQPGPPRHVGGAEARAATATAAAGRGVAVRLLRSVVAVVVGRVAPQLPAYG